MFGIRKLRKAIEKLIVSLEDNTRAIRLKRPGLVFLVFAKEENDMLFFNLVLPAPGASDVVSRKLSVQIGNADPVELTLAVSEPAPEMSGNDNDIVQGSLVDIDDANNPSDPSSFNFVLTDTIPPPAPGQVGLQVIREE